MNIPGQVVLGVLTSMAGIVVFGYYAKKGCDPLSQRVIKNPNQVTISPNEYLTATKVKYKSV